MNRFRLLMMAFVLIPLLVIAGNMLLYHPAPVSTSHDVPYTSFSIGGKTFKLTYLATSQSMIERGLMGTKVTSDTAMLFVFPNAGYYPFWMSGVNSSLDMIWVDAPAGSRVGHVVYLALDSPPCQASIFCQTYQPNAEADYVIETRAGFAMANGVTIGTPVVFN